MALRTIKNYPDAPTFVESTRSIGYSFETAVADIIDNSISKHADNIIVRFDSSEPRYLAVIDNGCGMSLDELIEAMKYGSKSSLDERAIDDLGRFGLGLKMASLSQCRRLTVVTKKDGIYSGAEWNLDMIGDWALIIYDADEITQLPCVQYLNQFKSGTIVLWRNFDRLGPVDNLRSDVFDKNIELTKKHLSLVFHRYLEPEQATKKIKIECNGVSLSAIDPFMTRNPATQIMDERIIELENQSIRVKPYVLPFSTKLSNTEKRLIDEVADLKLGQGFYVYRNKRLIVWGTWFRLFRQDELSRLARVRIDIPNSLDSIWGIDIKKSTASIPESIKVILKSIVADAGGRSEAVYKYRGRKVSDASVDHVWNVIDNRGTISYKVNRETALYKRIQDSLSTQEQELFNSLIVMIEDSFPYRDVYCRYAKSKDQDEEPIQNNNDFEDYYRAAESFLKTLMETGQSVTEALVTLKAFDFIQNHPDVLIRLEENYETK